MAQSIYYSNPANEKLGKICIGLPVFNLIAEKSIDEIEGVHVSGKNGILSELDGTDLTMTINTKISYGILASKASKEIQERVTRAIFDMSNVSPKAINVNVIGIEF
ncbi:MAG: Asp23/Gls24 family envelope stress response protein [Beduini sp.]|uniref:Asp23/Gls24 family envelope stress response protein n=1 Tax=Beduini sp. TaxID=1922300 RepID=UPI003990A4EE